MFSFQKINTRVETIEKIKDDWTFLLKSSGLNNLFVSWEWVSTWCTVMSDSDQKPLIIAARKGKRLIGLAPLMITLSEKQVPTVSLIGQSHSYHLGFIAEKGIEEQVYHALWSHLFEKVLKKIYSIRFLHMEEDGVFEFVLRKQAVKRGLIVQKGFQNPCKVLALPERFDDYLKTGIISAKLKRNLKQTFSRLKNGNTIDCFNTDKSNFQYYWNELIRLRTKETQRRFNRSVLFGHLRFVDHLKQIADIFDEKQELRLSVLMIDNEIAAINLAISYNKVRYGLTVSINTALFEKYKWMNICVHSVLLNIKEAIEEKCTEFDFLAGEASYKYKMGGMDRAGVMFSVFPTSAGT